MSADAETARTATGQGGSAATASTPVRGTAFGPGGRPTGGLRPYLAAVLAVAGLLAVPIMLSDQAPDFFDRVTDGIENSLPDIWWDDVKPLVPAGDVVMHLVFFGGLALVVGLLAWSWRSFVLGQVGVLSLGILLELAQPLVTSSRNIEVHDIASNLLGQAVGVAVALGCIQALSWRRRADGGERSR